MADLTPFVETNALLAVIGGDYGGAHLIVRDKMTPVERRELRNRLMELIDIIETAGAHDV